MGPMAPIMPPGGGGEPGGGPTGPGPEEQGPGVGGGFPAQPAQVNPQMEQALVSIKNIVAAARQIGSSFPSATAEIRTINAAVSRLAQKIHSSGPAPEPATPPV